MEMHTNTNTNTKTLIISDTSLKAINALPVKDFKFEFKVDGYLYKCLMVDVQWVGLSKAKQRIYACTFRYIKEKFE